MLCVTAAEEPNRTEHVLALSFVSDLAQSWSSLGVFIVVPFSFQVPRWELKLMALRA
jgi:hypothetical protein